ncbi:hypothetical protein P692DRAFT_20739544, partial [Suillus brevipes Sb2]
TVLGTVLSSDKTNITTMTGARLAHPLLLGLAIIHMKMSSVGGGHTQSGLKIQDIHQIKYIKKKDDFVIHGLSVLQNPQSITPQ